MFEYCVDGVVGGVVDCFGVGVEFVVFVYGEYQGGGFQGFWVYVFNKEFYGRGF